MLVVSRCGKLLEAQAFKQSAFVVVGMMIQAVPPGEQPLEQAASGAAQDPNKLYVRNVKV